jgi:mannonate dehydratase
MSDSQPDLTRRSFLGASLAAAGAAAVPVRGGAAAAAAPRPAAPGPRMKIGTYLQLPMTRSIQLVRQAGVEHAVTGLEVREDGVPWSVKSLQTARQRFQEAGLQLAVIESRPPMTRTKLGLPGRDEEIETVCELLKNMGTVGIHVWCYEWMVLGVRRTSRTRPTRAGAQVQAYDQAEETQTGLTEYGQVPAGQLWDALKYFLERVVPVAEKVNVKLAMHPDDPPYSPIRGVARIMSSLEDYQRLVDLVPSPVNGITFCQGNFTLMTDDLPAAIRRFGRHIHFVHFRDVVGTRTKFDETFPDAGKTNMAACMRAYRDIGFDGIISPDHWPVMGGAGGQRDGDMGRIFAIAYIRGLMDACYDL